MNPRYTELVIPGLPTLVIPNYLVIRGTPECVNRDLELRIKGHLYEIREVDDEVISSSQGFPKAEEGYRKTLESVAECANADLVDTVAEEIKDHIRTKTERPSNRSVRRDARLLLADDGIVPHEYLNRA